MHQFIRKTCFNQVALENLGQTIFSPFQIFIIQISRKLFQTINESPIPFLLRFKLHNLSGIIQIFLPKLVAMVCPLNQLPPLRCIDQLIIRWADIAQDLQVQRLFRQFNRTVDLRCLQFDAVLILYNHDDTVFHTDTYAIACFQQDLFQNVADCKI